ncbi:MAG: hypothetical protein IKO72_06625 [Kiritimatiellae bacterium]|nr:hypothetical protein [Kiritimatiellia bacterium]
MKKKEKLVPCLIRHGSTGMLEQTYHNYEGTITPKVWRMLCKHVRKLDEQGYFYPLDTMDAYQYAALCIEVKAAQMPPLDRATTETYLISTMRKCLWRFHVNKVLPVRETYREIEDRLFAKDALETCDCDDGEILSVQQLAEALPGLPDAEERRRFAAATLMEILDAIDNPEVSRAFTAYVVADGRFAEAARLAQISMSRFYARWKSWLTVARKAAEKVVVRI